MKKRLYLPLLLIELYLVFSLILLSIGPLNYTLHKTRYFTLLIVAYHCATIIGYCVGVICRTKCRQDIFCGGDIRIRKRFSLLIIIAFYIWIIVTRNITHASSYIPIDLFKRVITGIFNPMSNYSINKEVDSVTLFHGNKLLTGSVLLIYFLYYCFPALTIMYWKKIGRLQKVCSVVLIILSMFLGLASGTNASIFHTIISLVGGLGIRIILEANNKIKLIDYENKNKIKKKRKKIIRVVGILFALGILYFVYNISSRLNGNTLSYMSSKSTDISVSQNYYGLIKNPSTKQLVNGLASVQSYMCQGYYGMSLSLEKEFTTTYGIGHSFFLVSSIDNILGTSITDRTYQEKITDIWSSTGNWHSFYSQIANDVSFVGVIAVMFFLGFITAHAWKDVLLFSNPVAAMFIVVLMPVYIFIPMNNQMGNLYGTFFSFWVLLILWAITRKHVIVLGKIRI